MKAIILAAGRGSRMGDLTSQNPKCLVKLAGKPLLDYQLSAMQKAGISEIAVVAGYNEHMINDHRITVKYVNHNWERTNMVRSLMAADELLSTEPCIISYSDIFYTFAAIKSLIEADGEIAINYDPNFLDLWSLRFQNPLHDLESFQLDENHQLLAIGERANNLEEIQGQYMGLLKIRPNGWTKITSLVRQYDKEILDKLDMTSLLRQLLVQQVVIKAYPYYGQWGEVDNTSDLSLYEDWFSAEAAIK